MCAGQSRSRTGTVSVFRGALVLASHAVEGGGALSGAVPKVDRSRAVDGNTAVCKSKPAAVDDTMIWSRVIS